MQRQILEKIVMHSYMSRKPLICTIELTTTCNFRCVHCYIGEKDRDVFLSTKKALEFIDDVVKDGCMFITLTGGDPLLHPEFASIYKYARSKSNVTVFTNGFSMDDDIVDLFTAHKPAGIEITLYGASNDTYYRTTGIRGYEKVMDTIQRLKRIDVNLKLKAFLVKENICDWNEIKGIADRQGIPFYFDSFVISPYGSAEYLHQIPLELQRTIFNQYKKNAEVSDELKAAIEKNGDRFYRCGAGIYSMWLRADNTLNMCAFSSNQKAISLDRNTYEEAWKQLGKEANRPIPASMKCRKCSQQDCLGCPTKYAAVYGEKMVGSCSFCDGKG